MKYLNFVLICTVLLFGVTYSSNSIFDMLNEESVMFNSIVGVEPKEQPKQYFEEKTVTELKQTTINKYETIIDSLYLTGCYITQTQESHEKKGNGSMYAYDIGCGGKSFDIYAPKTSTGYIVSNIGYDDLLGNYVELSYTVSGQVFNLLFGHTEYVLADKVGTYISSGQVFGKTVLKGKTSGYHLHYEKWTYDQKGNKVNVLFEDDTIVNPSSSKLIEQRKTRLIKHNDKKYNINFNKIKEDLKVFECKGGYTLESYWDEAQYSIGCGTKSPVQKKGHKITREEADSLLDDAINRRLKLIGSTLKNYNQNQQSALFSLYYNCPAWYKRVVKEGVTRENFLKCSTIKGGTVFVKGLYNRRVTEFELFNK